MNTKLLTLGEIMDLICDHPAANTAAFYADVATGAAQAGLLIDRLRAQLQIWSMRVVFELIRTVETQGADPLHLRAALDGFQPVELPELMPVLGHTAAAATAFRLGRLLFLTFLSNRTGITGIDLSAPAAVEMIADRVSQAIEMVARFRQVPMADIEAILHMEVA